jgi:putative flippase GtrA
MFHKIRPHIGQFALYIVSGLTAAAVDLGSFLLLFQIIGIWYVTASVVGSILGFCTAFLCHKYFVFKKKKEFMKHLGRYFVVDMVSTALATLILFGLVEHLYLPEESAKVLSMGSVILWNYFLYKFFVYV